VCSNRYRPRALRPLFSENRLQQIVEHSNVQVEFINDAEQFSLGYPRLQSEAIDLSWLDSIDPEIEQHLLPVERAMLTALRRYRTIYRQNPNEPARVAERS